MLEREPKTEISFSMQNLLNKSTIWSIIIPTERYATIAKSAGYDGVEFFPNRIWPNIDGQNGSFSDFTKLMIKSGHQSWRSENTIKEARRHSNPSLAIQAFFLLPERNYSLKHLKKLQETMGNIPLVIYPPHLWQGEYQHPPIFSDLNNTLMQPTPELLELWNISSIEGFPDAMKYRGYDGFCLDLFHMRRYPAQDYKSQLPHWKEILPVFLPHTKEIHVSVGRNDLKGNFDSMAELKDLYFNKKETEVVPILEAIRDFGWKGLITTEIPSDSLKPLIPTSSKILTPKIIVDTHKIIVDNLKKIMKV